MLLICIIFLLCELTYFIGVLFTSGVADITFDAELGVLKGVFELEKPVGTVSVSIFTVVLFEKSKPLLIGAVVSVG